MKNALVWLVSLVLISGCSGEKGNTPTSAAKKNPLTDNQSRFGEDFLAEILAALGGSLSSAPVAQDETVPFPKAEEISAPAARLHVLAQAATTRGDRDFFIYLQDHPDYIYQVDSVGQGLAHKLVQHDIVGPLKVFATKHYSGLAMKDDWGRFPIHYAKSRTMVEFIWDLEVADSLEHEMSARSPKYRWPDRDGQTPFHRLALKGDADAVAWVVNKSCSLMMALPNVPWVHETDDMELKDLKGRTALHMAAIRGDVAVMQAMLGCWSLDGSFQDNDGNTALHFAQACGHAEVAAQLISSGKVPISARNNAGELYSEAKACPKAE